MELWRYVHLKCYAPSGLWNTDSLPFNQANCNANPGFKPVASGGNGNSIQYCKTLTSYIASLTYAWVIFERAGYVGYDPNLNTVVVSHQGTDPSGM